MRIIRAALIMLIFCGVYLIGMCLLAGDYLKRKIKLKMRGAKEITYKLLTITR